MKCAVNPRDNKVQTTRDQQHSPLFVTKKVQRRTLASGTYPNALLPSSRASTGRLRAPPPVTVAFARPAPDLLLAQQHCGHTSESRGRNPRCAAFTDKSDPGGALRLSTPEIDPSLHGRRRATRRSGARSSGCSGGARAALHVHSAERATRVANDDGGREQLRPVPAPKWLAPRSRMPHIV